MGIDRGLNGLNLLNEFCIVLGLVNKFGFI